MMIKPQHLERVALELGAGQLVVVLTGEDRYSIAVDGERRPIHTIRAESQISEGVFSPAMNQREVRVTPPTSTPSYAASSSVPRRF
jgi:hypothetical protein